MQGACCYDEGQGDTRYKKSAETSPCAPYYSTSSSLTTQFEAVWAGRAIVTVRQTRHPALDVRPGQMICGSRQSRAKWSTQFLSSDWLLVINPLILLVDARNQTQMNRVIKYPPSVDIQTAQPVHMYSQLPIKCLLRRINQILTL